MGTTDHSSFWAIIALLLLLFGVLLTVFGPAVVGTRLSAYRIITGTVPQPPPPPRPKMYDLYIGAPLNNKERAVCRWSELHPLYGKVTMKEISHDTSLFTQLKWLHPVRRLLPSQTGQELHELRVNTAQIAIPILMPSIAAHIPVADSRQLPDFVMGTAVYERS